MSDVVDFTSPESSERPPRTRRGGRQRRLPVPEGRQLDREYLHRCIDGLCDAMARGQEREAEGWLARLECKAGMVNDSEWARQALFRAGFALIVDSEDMSLLLV